MLRAALLAVLALLLLPAAAGAYVVREGAIIEAPANGIVLGPDGNFWVAEPGKAQVRRVSPGGQTLGKFPVGADPTSLVTGGGGRLWISGTGTDSLYWIDATGSSPSVHPVPVPGTCGPVGITSGDDGRIYFSAPAQGGCATNHIGRVDDDGTGLLTVAVGTPANDVEVAGGWLFVPSLTDGKVRRYDPATLTLDATISVPGNEVAGIAADGDGTVWLTIFRATGQNVARFPAGAPDGSAATAVEGSEISFPFGLVAGADGRMYVAAANASELVRIERATGAIVRYPTPSARPWQIINGSDGDIWFTDLNVARLFRFVNSAPRATTVAARALANTAGFADAKVDSRGNATQVVFDYGTTTAYGSTTSPQNVAAGIGANDVRADLPDLQPGTSYHVRVRASNAEGSVTGEDVAFTTPEPEPTPVRAAVSFRWGFTPSYTILTRVRVRQVTRADKIKLTCKGRGCGVKKKTVRNKQGTVKFTKHFGAKRKLRKGTKVRLRITAPNKIGSVVTLKVRRGKDPKITRRCTLPGSSELRKSCSVS